MTTDHRTGRTRAALPIAFLLAAATLILATPATACIFPSAGIFFDPDDDLRGVTKPIVARITIVSVWQPNEIARLDEPFRYLRIATATVDRTLRGAIDHTVITILTGNSDCEVGFPTGRSGVIAGDLQAGPNGEPALLIEQESVESRSDRRSAK